MPAGARFVFGAFDLDAGRRRLTNAGEPVALSDRQLDVLLLLVARAGQVVSKDDLIQAGWKDVAVSDNSVEQAISSLRRTLGVHPGGGSYIDTVARRGYRFGAAVERKAIRETDAALDALLAPYRAFVEGRAALETLERDQVAHARLVFERALADVPDHASAHVGLANACAMQFEMTRADPVPEAGALDLAVSHAREACRLDAGSGEAWATLGFVFSRAGRRLDALAAAKRAVAIEPGNWRHWFRLGFVGWGEERLHAAQRTLALLPGQPHAHWLAATVYVARDLPGEAERELRAALEFPAPAAPFGTVALHWLLGRPPARAETLALEEFASWPTAWRHPTRECCANTCTPSARSSSTAARRLRREAFRQAQPESPDTRWLALPFPRWTRARSTAEGPNRRSRHSLGSARAGSSDVCRYGRRR